MLRLATDEDFNNRIVRGVLRRLPELDLVRVQDVGLAGKIDTEIPEWGASEGRVLFTYDVSTMQPFAYQRVAAGLPMPGVFEVSQDLPIGPAIEEILLLAECSKENEWEGQIRFLPLRQPELLFCLNHHPAVGALAFDNQFTGLMLQDWQGKAESHCAHDAGDAAGR
jgi:Domain of unknown function (DUF5615)